MEAINDRSQVYQMVLDGRKPLWWFAPGWWGENPKLPGWGSGYTTETGDTNTFSNVKLNSTHWETLTENVKTGATSTNTFALGSKIFDKATFAAEFYHTKWILGPVTFKDVELVAEGSADSKWCTKPDPIMDSSPLTFKISNTKASVSGTTVTCTIESVVLEGPA